MSILELITAVKSLTWGNVAKIWALLLLFVPAGVLWWSLHDGRDAVIDWRSGERVVRVVAQSCLLLESRQGGQRRWRIVQGLESDGDVDYTLSAASFEQWDNVRGNLACAKLQTFKRGIEADGNN
jgi:hypothetical protein